MKIYFPLIVIFTLKSFYSHSQNAVRLDYATTHNFSTKDLQGNLLSGPTVNLTTKVLYSNNKVLSYQVPLYLKEFPDGQIQMEIKEKGITMATPIVMDSIQMLRYYNLDSLFFITRVDNPKTGLSNPNEIRNQYFQFEHGFERWELLPDSMLIEGKWCRRAQMRYSHNNEILYDFWYTDEIPIPLGPMGYVELPGLVIKGIMPPLGYSFELAKYDLQAIIAPQEMWKKELDERYIKKAFIPSLRKSSK